MTAHPDPSQRLAMPTGVMEDAANWVIRMRYEAPDEKTQREFSQWLNGSDDHAQAWAQAER
ncbi:MAG: FecR/PupR family sigma factor regulator, partial [Alcaligenaceae bacterium]